jgi:hypothetical protein
MEQEANTKCSFSYAANCDSFALHTAMTKSHERYIDLISKALLFVGCGTAR